MNWGNWATVASLATAFGALVLALATLSTVKSAHRTGQGAQPSQPAGLPPVLMATRRGDPSLKARFADQNWLLIPGGSAIGQIGVRHKLAEPVYLAMGLRNAGHGIAVIHGWRFYPQWCREATPAPLAEFERQHRELHIPAGHIGFWQGTFGDPADLGYEQAREAIAARQPWTVELLYGDHAGGQRCISRFTMLPRAARNPAGEPDAGWVIAQSRHWNIDAAEPACDERAAVSQGIPSSLG